MLLMRMHAAVRKQPHEMQGAVFFLQACHHAYKGRIFFKAAILDIARDAQKILIDHAACAKIQMANLRIPLLTIGKPDGFAAAGEGRVRTFCKQRIETRCLSQAGSIVGAVWIDSPAVEDH